jgi:hypothetical protein
LSTITFLCLGLAGAAGKRLGDRAEGFADRPGAVAHSCRAADQALKLAALAGECPRALQRQHRV